jgi:hypothetical protein
VPCWHLCWHYWHSYTQQLHRLQRCECLLHCSTLASTRFSLVLPILRAQRIQICPTHDASAQLLKAITDYSAAQQVASASSRCHCAVLLAILLLPLLRSTHLIWYTHCCQCTLHTHCHYATAGQVLRDSRTDSTHRAVQCRLLLSQRGSLSSANRRHQQQRLQHSRQQLHIYRVQLWGCALPCW